MVTIGPVVLEEKSFEIVDGRTTEPTYTISSPVVFGSGELKKRKTRFVIPDTNVTKGENVEGLESNQFLQETFLFVGLIPDHCLSIYFIVVIHVLFCMAALNQFQAQSVWK